MNPPGSNNDGESNYQVTEMDSAAIDRFIWLEMESNIRDWIDWAASSLKSESVEEESGTRLKEGNKKQRIHPEIVQFINQNPSVLNVEPTETKPITPSPRSWEMVSDCYYVYEANTKVVNEKLLYEIAKGAAVSYTHLTLPTKRIV